MKSELIFHKSCYTARSSGYKYRTLSTNTGDRKKRDSKEDNAFERKFRELTTAILTRVDKELSNTNKARNSILERFAKLDAKINSMVELQKTVSELHKTLEDVSFALSNMIDKVDRIEVINYRAEMMSQQSNMTGYKSQEPIAEEREERESIITHI